MGKFRNLRFLIGLLNLTNAQNRKFEIINDVRSFNEETFLMGNVVQNRTKIL